MQKNAKTLLKKQRDDEHWARYRMSECCNAIVINDKDIDLTGVREFKRCTRCNKECNKTVGSTIYQDRMQIASGE